MIQVLEAAALHCRYLDSPMTCGDERYDPLTWLRTLPVLELSVTVIDNLSREKTVIQAHKNGS